jgi:hypothetical protein
MMDFEREKNETKSTPEEIKFLPDVECTARN